MSVHPLFPAEHHFTNRKITPANNARGPQFVPEARMIIDADPLEYDSHTGVEYVSTRQMCWACAVLFVVIVAVSFLPISI